MTLLDSLSSIHKAGGTVWVDDQTVRYRAPVGVITPAVKSILANSKALLLDLLPVHEREPEGELQWYESLSVDQQERCLQQSRSDWQTIVAKGLRTNEQYEQIPDRTVARDLRTNEQIPDRTVARDLRTNEQYEQIPTRPGISSLVRIETTVETKWYSTHFSYSTYPAGTQGWLCNNLNDIPDGHTRFLIREGLRTKVKAGKPHYPVWLCGTARILPVGDVRIIG